METLALYLWYIIIYLLQVIFILILLSIIYKILDFLYWRFTKLWNIIMMYNKMTKEDKDKIEKIYLKY